MPIRRALLAILILLTATLLHRHWLPPQWDPTQPLDLHAPPNRLTPLKIRLLNTTPTLCAAALATAPLVTRPASLSGPCPLPDALRILTGPIPTDPATFLASCRLAVDWSLFLTTVVQPTAQATYGQPVTSIHHLGTYACRDVRNQPGHESSHARADAIDVASFTLDHGHTIPVSAWTRTTTDSTFLHNIRNGACRIFGIVLSPDYNILHATHLHLQASGFGPCH